MRYSLHITNICNLRCTYCYEDDKDVAIRKNFVISEEEIDARMEEFKQKGDCEGLELLGGEVFLFFDRLKYIFNNYGESYPLTITTNGTIRTPEIDEYINKYRPSIAVSLDSPKTVEIQRVGLNLQEVLANAKAWQKMTDVSIAAVITPQNINDIKETFDFYVLEHGFNTIHFGLVEEWMNDYYWRIYIKEGKRLIEQTAATILRDNIISPWRNYAPFFKEFVYEDGVEKVEIFNTSKINLSPYIRAKHEIHLAYCDKIKIEPSPLVPEGAVVVQQ